MGSSLLNGGFNNLGPNGSQNLTNPVQPRNPTAPAPYPGPNGGGSSPQLGGLFGGVSNLTGLGPNAGSSAPPTTMPGLSGPLRGMNVGNWGPNGVSAGTPGFMGGNPLPPNLGPNAGGSTPSPSPFPANSPFAGLMGGAAGNLGPNGAGPDRPMGSASMLSNMMARR